MTDKFDKNIELGNEVRKARKLAGLTQIELASMAGVGKSLIFSLEKGSTSISLENILKVLKILNIKIEFKSLFQVGNE
jgi:HTH-type transcriptional regulator/antitoxin HipB